MSDPAFRLDGRRALVTGGSRGIGLGTAAALAEAGASVALVARSADTLRTATDSLRQRGADARSYAHDLADIDGIDPLYEEVVADGKVDVVVNCAGIIRRGHAHQIDDADWELVHRVNVTAAFRLCRAFARERIAAGAGGAVVNIASIMSEQPRRQNAPYASSKGAIRQLTKALAVDWAGYGIRVNAIGPGYVKTDMTSPLWQDQEFETWVCQRTPLARWGAPEEIGRVAVFLASDAASYITGQVLYVDGGLLATY